MACPAFSTGLPQVFQQAFNRLSTGLWLVFDWNFNGRGQLHTSKIGEFSIYPGYDLTLGRLCPGCGAPSDHSRPQFGWRDRIA
jgi:hypothetical protein